MPLTRRSTSVAAASTAATTATATNISMLPKPFVTPARSGPASSAASFNDVAVPANSSNNTVPPDSSSQPLDETTAHHVTPVLDKVPSGEISMRANLSSSSPPHEEDPDQKQDISPTNSSSLLHNHTKQVRFDANNNPESSLDDNTTEGAASSTKQQQAHQHFVSRRGRYLSPGHRSGSFPLENEREAETTGAHHDTTTAQAKEAATVVQAEYPTFRSPSRLGDEVPSLCSAGSGEMPSSLTSSLLPHQPTRTISCDPACVEQTSPLGDTADSSSLTTALQANHPNNNSSSRSQPDQKDDIMEDGHQNRAYSPPVDDKTNGNKKKVSHNSPLRISGEKMLSMDDHHGNHTYMFSSPTRDGQRGFDEKKQSETPPPRSRGACTPTDFSMDYGKNNAMMASLDTSNVLAWLQSPTSNGLFSPGGYASIMNTPGGPRTPRTPTVSTSFFFSDVACLPRGDQTPCKQPNQSDPNSSSAKRKGLSNIICISPLASNKGRGNHGGSATPMNLKDVFASPAGASHLHLEMTPARPQPRVQRSGSKDPCLDAVHLAERDLMEDEDMSVLLQLASNTTPRSAAAAGVVFRSPSSRQKDKHLLLHHHHHKGGENKSNNLPALQLPMIGGQDPDHDNGVTSSSSSSRLAQKPKSRGLHGDADDFAPPQLGMRSSPTTGSKEIVVGARGRTSSSNNDRKEVMSMDKESDTNTALSKMPRKSPSPNMYPMHPPPYPPQRDISYYPMPPGSMPPGMPSGPPGGSMRVVVGGPPPPKGSPARMGGSSPPHPSPYHDYPSPYPPPPPGMYSHQYGAPMGYPYQNHYPPHRHMPMYGAQQQQPPQQQQQQQQAPLGKKAKPSSVPSFALKGSKPSGAAGTKRGASVLDAKGASGSKKAKRSPTKKKKIISSPTIADRGKAVASVHAVNQASGGKNDRAAALAAAILRGVTMRPSGKWQAQLYFAGKSRYIGVFDSREKAALAYEIAREKLKAGPQDSTGNTTENLVNAARKAAFEGVNERLI